MSKEKRLKKIIAKWLKLTWEKLPSEFQEAEFRRYVTVFDAVECLASRVAELTAERCSQPVLAGLDRIAQPHMN